MECLSFNPFLWLKDAAIFNKNNEQVPTEWIEANADIIVLLFTANDVDKNGIIEMFYEIYENVKFVSLPIEVIHVPMDDTEENASSSYEKQANWFTLKFTDPLILTLKYFYEISSIPHLLVIKPDSSIVSRHGIFDLEEYGKNAVISWLTNASSTSKQRCFSKELSVYGGKWNYMNVDPRRGVKVDYHRKFSEIALEETQKHSD